MAHSMVQTTIVELTLRETIKDENGNIVYTPQNGHVYADTVTGKKYTLSIDNGVINKVEV